MTDEQKQLRDVVIKCLIVLCFSFLYSLSGSDFGFKWERRYVATAILVLGNFGFSRDWRSLIGFPLLVIGTSLGYGADHTWLKIIKRTYCGLILAFGSTSSDWLNKRYLIAIWICLVIVSGSIIMGVWNLLPDARTEEFFLGLLIALPIFSARRR